MPGDSDIEELPDIEDDLAEYGDLDAVLRQGIYKQADRFKSCSGSTFSPHVGSGSSSSHMLPLKTVI